MDFLIHILQIFQTRVNRNEEHGWGEALIYFETFANRLVTVDGHIENEPNEIYSARRKTEILIENDFCNKI